MLLAECPIALIFPAICPLVDTIPVLLVQTIVAFVASSVAPLVLPMAMHVVIKPLAGILPPVNPGIGPETLYSVFDPVSIVNATISPRVRTFAVLLSHEVVSLVARAVGPNFLAWPVLHITLPVAFIPRAIHVGVNTVSIGLVIEPLTLKHITIYVPEFAPTTGLIVPPKALVAGTIGPDLYPKSMLHVSKPLPFVHGSIFENYIAAFFDHLTLKTFRKLAVKIVNSLASRHVVHVQIGSKGRPHVLHTFPDEDTSEKRLDAHYAMNVPFEMPLLLLADVALAVFILHCDKLRWLTFCSIAVLPACLTHLFIII